MGVFPDGIHEIVCGLYLPMQYETRVSLFEAKADECDKISEGIHSVEQVCSIDVSHRGREVP